MSLASWRSDPLSHGLRWTATSSSLVRAEQLHAVLYHSIGPHSCFCVPVPVVLAEDAQRLLPCHNDPYPKWKTKKFKLKEVYNPLSGKKEQMHVFEDMRTEPYKKGEPELNVIHLSSTLPDERGKTGSAEEATHPAAS